MQTSETENKTSELCSELERHITEIALDLDYEALQEDYKQTSVALIKGFLTESLVQRIRAITYDCLDKSGYERDLKLQTTDFSPRKYISVGYSGVKENAPIVDSLHKSPAFLQIVRKITDLTPESPEFAAERYIINQQKGVGHTHGWHWDDYSLAIGLCIDDAADDYGGRLECVPSTLWNKEKPNIVGVLANNRLYSIKPRSGDVYINRADTTLHRVSPLEAEHTVRTMIIMSYQTEADIGKNLRFETMEELYPEDCS